MVYHTYMDTLGEKLGLSQEIHHPVEIDEHAEAVSKYIYKTFDRDFNDDAKYILINDDWSIFGIQANQKLHVISYQLIGVISLADLTDIVYSNAYDIEHYIHPMNKRSDFSWGFYKSTIEPSVKDHTDAPGNYIIPLSITGKRGMREDMASIPVFIPTDLKNQANIENIAQYGSSSAKMNLRVSINYKIQEIYVRPPKL